MNQLTVLSFDASRAFENRRSLDRAIDRGSKKAMPKALARIQNRAIKSIRRSPNASRPNEPPHTHSSGRRSIRSIFWDYDSRASVGIVGPIKTTEREPRWLQSIKGVPELLEVGGSVTIREVAWRIAAAGITWRLDKGRRVRPGQRRRSRRARFRKRPTMKPALDAEIDSGDLMDPWAMVVI